MYFPISKDFQESQIHYNQSSSPRRTDKLSSGKLILINERFSECVYYLCAKFVAIRFWPEYFRAYTPHLMINAETRECKIILWFNFHWTIDKCREYVVVSIDFLFHLLFIVIIFSFTMTPADRYSLIKFEKSNPICIIASESIKIFFFSPEHEARKRDEKSYNANLKKLLRFT